MSDNRDDQDRQIAELLGEDSAPTSELHDARVRAAIKKSAQRIQERNAQPQRTTTPWRPWAAALAASFVAAMVVIYAPIWNGGEDNVVRSLDPAGTITPAPESILTQPPKRFGWPAQAAATRYRLTLRDNTGNRIWTTTSDQTEVVLDPDVAKTLQPDVSYIWSVAAEGSGPYQELGPYWFRIDE